LRACFVAAVVLPLASCDANGEYDEEKQKDCARIVERAAQSLDGRNTLEVVLWSCKDKSRNRRAVYLTQIASGDRRIPYLLFIRAWNTQAAHEQTTLVAWSATNPSHAFIKNVEEEARGGEWLPGEFSHKGIRFSTLASGDAWPPPGAMAEGDISATAPR
jgi:hypothetical protein